MREGLLAALGSEGKVQFQCGITDVKSNGSFVFCFINCSLFSLSLLPLFSVRFGNICSFSEKGGATVFGSNGAELGDFDLVIDASGVATPLRKLRVPGTELKEWYTGIVSLGGIVQVFLCCFCGFCVLKNWYGVLCVKTQQNIQKNFFRTPKRNSTPKWCEG